MPALPKILRKGVVYLYRTRDEAERDSNYGGTAAIIGKKVDEVDFNVIYLVSNRHVVFEGAASVVRINRLDGSAPDVFETEPHEWFPHPEGDDLVIRPAGDFINTQIHDFGFNSFDKLVCREDVTRGDVDVGDEVFMVGRFIGLQAGRQNDPALRFGNISTLNTQVKHPIYGRKQNSFAVEMRSRSGFSGSPVFVYWSKSSNLVPRQSGKNGYVALLGLNWGFIIDHCGENTWLNGIVPGWRIRDLFDIPEIIKHQSEQSDKFKSALDLLTSLTSLLSLDKSDNQS